MGQEYSQERILWCSHRLALTHEQQASKSEVHLDLRIAASLHVVYEAQGIQTLCGRRIGLQLRLEHQLQSLRLQKLRRLRHYVCQYGDVRLDVGYQSVAAAFIGRGFTRCIDGRLQATGGHPFCDLKELGFAFGL